VGGWPCTRSRGGLKLPDNFHSIRAFDCTPTFIPILVDGSRSTGKRAAQTGVFRRSAAFQDSPSEMLRTSTRRPPAGRSVVCALRVHKPSAGEGPPAGRSPSPRGPKPPSGDGSVGVGPNALGLPFALRPACANASEGRPRAFWRRAEAFAQAGRRAKSTKSMLPAFDFSVAPRPPLLAKATT
jgi:hypothetical protein